MQNHILAADPFGQLPREIKSDGSRYFEPGFAGGHARRHIRTAHAGGKSAQRPVCTGVGVRTDNHIPRHRQPFLRQQRMLYAHLPHFEIVGDLIFVRKLPHTFAVLCGFDILVGHKMIGHQGDLILVKHPPGFHLVHLLNGHRGGDVVAQHQIETGLD